MVNTVVVWTSRSRWGGTDVDGNLVVDQQPPEHLRTALVDVATASPPGTPAIMRRLAKELALASRMAAAGFFILMNTYAA
jgi:hypothetical protein